MIPELPSQLVKQEARKDKTDEFSRETVDNIFKLLDQHYIEVNRMLQLIKDVVCPKSHIKCRDCSFYKMPVNNPNLQGCSGKVILNELKRDLKMLRFELDENT